MGDARDQAIEAGARATFGFLWPSATDEAREKYRVFANTVLDAAHAAGLIRYTDELEEVGRLSLEGEFWPSDAGYFYADEPVFVVRDRNTEAGT